MFMIRIALLIFISNQAFAELDLSFGLSFNKNQANYYPSPLVLKAGAAINLPKKVATIPFINVGNSYEKLMPPKDFTYKKGVSPKPITLPKITLYTNASKQTIHAANEYTIKALSDRPQTTEMRILSENLDLEKLIEISENEYKMIQALIFKEIQNKLEPAFVLFVDLMKSEFKAQATWNYAEIAKQFSLNHEFKNKMLTLALEKQNTSYSKKALDSLVKNAELLTISDVELIETKASKADLTLKNDHYTLKKAQYLEQEGDLSAALSLLNGIGGNSKVVVESRILASNLKYRLGDLSAATKTLESAVPVLSKDTKNKMRNLTHLTLGRLYFQNGKYKQAYDSYLKIDKSSGFWLQSSTEQALAQIMNADYIGAAGNMFSLHTAYFKQAYAPNSYVVRAVGYLNLCQYGDAVSVIADLDRRYTSLAENLAEFKASHSSPSAYYDLARGALSAQESDNKSSIPKAFIIEMARDPSFMAMQFEINKAEQEISQFQQISQNVATKSQKINSDIAAVEEKNPYNNNLASSTNRQLALKLEQNILTSAKPRIDRVKSEAYEKIQQDKVKLKSNASIMLQSRFNRELSSLTEIIQQKDVLAYEIYSGAGEQLRFQMAGGQVEDRQPANETALTPEEKKSYRWKYRGELWEDEIGHYRSSLTNICSKK